MVSNTLEMGAAELVRTLKRIKREHGDDPEYRALRGELPRDWPM